MFAFISTLGGKEKSIKATNNCHKLCHMSLEIGGRPGGYMTHEIQDISIIELPMTVC